MARIRIDYSKCTGCRLCETASSLSHLEDISNPKRAGIRIFSRKDVWCPVIAGPFTDAKCTSKLNVVVEGEEFNERMICRASCSAKPVLKEPDSGIPLKCDMCGEPPNLQCVPNGAPAVL